MVFSTIVLNGSLKHKQNETFNNDHSPLSTDERRQKAARHKIRSWILTQSIHRLKYIRIVYCDTPNVGWITNRAKTFHWSSAHICQPSENTIVKNGINYMLHGTRNLYISDLMRIACKRFTQIADKVKTLAPSTHTHTHHAHFLRK